MGIKPEVVLKYNQKPKQVDMPDKTAKATGKRIRRFRKDCGLSQAALAKRAGLQTNTVARLERGEHRISDKTLEKLTKALSVTSSDILHY